MSICLLKNCTQDCCMGEKENMKCYDGSTENKLCYKEFHQIELHENYKIYNMYLFIESGVILLFLLFLYIYKKWYLIRLDSDEIENTATDSNFNQITNLILHLWRVLTEILLMKRNNRI